MYRFYLGGTPCLVLASCILLHLQQTWQRRRPRLPQLCRIDWWSFSLTTNVPSNTIDMDPISIYKLSTIIRLLHVHHIILNRRISEQTLASYTNCNGYFYMAIDSMTRTTQKVCRTTNGDITSDVASPTMLPALKFSSDPGCTYAFAKCSWLGPKSRSAI